MVNADSTSNISPVAADFHVVSFLDPSFDNACEYAYRIAVDRIGIDEYGNSSITPEWNRSTCSLKVKFQEFMVSGGMDGVEYIYKFTASIERSK